MYNLAVQSRCRMLFWPFYFVHITSWPTLPRQQQLCHDNSPGQEIWVYFQLLRCFYCHFYIGNLGWFALFISIVNAGCFTFFRPCYVPGPSFMPPRRKLERQSQQKLFECASKPAKALRSSRCSLSSTVTSFFQIHSSRFGAPAVAGYKRSSPSHTMYTIEGSRKANNSF